MPWALAVAVLSQLQLDWRAAPGCPDADAVQAAVARWAGAPSDAPLVVRGEVTKSEAGRFTLTLDVEGRGVRTLEGQSCAELTEAGALVLALLLDPGVLSRPPPVGAATAPAEPERAVHLDVALDAVGDWGALPSLAPGWHATLALDWKRLRLALFGGTFLSQQVRSPAGTVSLDFDAGVRPCVTFDLGRVTPMACAALALGRSSAVAQVNTPQPASALFAAGYLGGALAVRLVTNLSLVAHLEAGVPFIRTLYYLEPTGEALFAMKLFVARGELGLAVRFW